MSRLSQARVIEINEFIEAEAHASFFKSAPVSFSRPFQLEIKPVASVWVSLISKTDNVSYNRILGYGVREPATETMLDEAIAIFENANCNNYSMQVCSLVQPPDSLQWIAERGFTQGRNWAKTYRGTEPPPAITTTLRLEAIGIEHADTYADIVSRVFGITPAYHPLIKGIVGKPGWHIYLGYDGEKPVAATAMFIQDQSAWLGFMATLPTYRNRGAQTAMYARCIKDGLDLGCKWFVGETKEDTPSTPNPSYRNAIRNGFKLAYMQRSYYHHPPESTVKRLRRGVIVSAYGLKFQVQRLLK